jgi:hypothetical protein
VTVVRWHGNPDAGGIGETNNKIIILEPKRRSFAFTLIFCFTFVSRQKWNEKHLPALFVSFVAMTKSK